MFNNAALQRAAADARNPHAYGGEFDREWCQEHDAWTDECHCDDEQDAAIAQAMRRVRERCI